MEDTLPWAIALVVVVAIALVRHATRRGQPGPPLDIGREIKSGITALGCLICLVLTFGGMIALAYMSVAKSDQATLAGIVTVVASVLGPGLVFTFIVWPRGSPKGLTDRRRGLVSIFSRRKQPSADYVSPAAADAFVFGQTGSAAFLPAGWRGPKDERDVTLAATDEEYWAAMYPTGLLDRQIAEAYMLGRASRKDVPAR